MPRLSDKFLGECGSRRFVQRAELDASSDDSGDKDYKHWGETVFAALQKGLPAVRLMPLLSRFARSCFASAFSAWTVSAARPIRSPCATGQCRLAASQRPTFSVYVQTGFAVDDLAKNMLRLSCLRSAIPDVQNIILERPHNDEQ